VGDGTWGRALALGVLLVVGLVLAVTVRLPSVEEIRSSVDEAGSVGWAAMVVGLAVVLLAPIPRSAVSVAVGVVAGFGPGLAVAMGGAVIAAGLAFALSRTLGRSAATRLIGARFPRVDRVMADRGFVSVLVGRLLPIMPFVVLSYGAGLTRIRPAPYMLATAIGLVPGTVVQVGIGASAGFVLSYATTLTVVPLVVVVLVPVVLGALAWRRRRLRRRPAVPGGPDESAAELLG
jgi:uncharacterized membrane protein YdjX (TVP38/TMEM64 family)